MDEIVRILSLMANSHVRRIVPVPLSEAHGFGLTLSAEWNLLLLSLFPGRSSNFFGNLCPRMQGKRRETLFCVVALRHEYRPAIGTSLAPCAWPRNSGE